MGRCWGLTLPCSPAATGAWDFTGAGWSPDWYGNGAVTWFNPLFSSPGGFPPNGGSNFGYFSDPTVNSLVKQALAQTTETQADVYWAKADEAVMSAAAVYPITADEEFAEQISAQPGFVSYEFMDCGDGQIMTSPVS